MFVTFMVLPFYWIRAQFLRRFGSDEKKYKEMKMYPRHYFGFRGIKVVSHGFMPDEKTPIVFVSNHQSQNDIFITLSAINRPFRFIAKKELFENIITGPFMKMSESYPLDREDARKSLTMLKQAVDDANQGHSILAFPEGTRSYQKEMLPFKDGIFSMLRKVKVPIVVLYIKESYDESQKEMHVYFDEPLQVESFKNLKGIQLSELVKERMNQLKEEAYTMSQ